MWLPSLSHVYGAAVWILISLTSLVLLLLIIILIILLMIVNIPHSESHSSKFNNVIFLEFVSLHLIGSILKVLDNKP